MHRNDSVDLIMNERAKMYFRKYEFVSSRFLQVYMKIGIHKMVMLQVILQRIVIIKEIEMTSQENCAII